MDSNKLKVILVMIVALFAAVYLGITSVTAQLETVVWMLGGIIIVVCLMMGRHIWLLIPFLTAVNLQFRIPGSPSTLLLAQIIVLGFAFLLVASRKLRISFRISELELWICGLAVLLLQVYLRNPTGILLFQSENVGGKAYIVTAITFVSAIYLCGIVTEVKDLKRIFPLVMVGSFINLTIGIAGKFIPILGYYTGSSFTYNDLKEASEADKGVASRFVEFSTFGKDVSLWVSSFKNPLRAALDPKWVILILVSLACALLGGYRSGFFLVVLTYIVGTWYRGGFGAVFAGAFAGCFGILLLAFVNLIHPLPANVQRALTIVPGTWEQRYKDDAKGSTDWRVEIWKEVLTSDRWIKNKMIGDGLGLSKELLAYQMSLNQYQASSKGISGFDGHRENILASGDYHSGPVTTIRVVGYVGLAFLLLFQIRLAVHAHRQIIRCRGTEWYPLALLIGIPLICAPVMFHLVFGDFRSEAVTILMGAGMIRILERGLPLPKYQSSRRLA